MATFHATFHDSDTLRASFSDSQSMAASFGEVVEVDKHLDFFEGPYEVTPTQETQILAVEMKVAAQNIVINPIPNNYGLITWDGSKLMVS